jgi:osmoprotectant transport system ATP-binding protein
MIRLVGVTKTYEGSERPAVDALDLDVPRGDLVALVGPSGCGKTTTLKMINRLIEPTSGTVEIEGHDVRNRPAHELRRGIGYVIQQSGLFPHRTIADNIGTVPKLLGWSKQRIRGRVHELVDLVGLDPDMLGRYPLALSGGQQQRVGVARALAADPPILLMDEPYSAVDPIVRARLQDELLALQARVHKTIVLVTHDIDEAIKLANRIAVLEVGGILQQVGPPVELLRDPANDFVAGFLGEDRGIKRLSLLRVRDVDLQRGPVVDAAATPGDAREVMDRERVDWVGVVDGERLLGWASVTAMNGHARMSDVPLERFAAEFGVDASLRHVLDGIVRSRTRVAVVTGPGDRYLGMVTIDEIGEGVL